MSINRPDSNFNPQVSINPAARPVDTFVAPQAPPIRQAPNLNNQWLQVSKGLAQLSPALANLVNVAANTSGNSQQNKEDFAKGEVGASIAPELSSAEGEAYKQIVAAKFPNFKNNKHFLAGLNSQLVRLETTNKLKELLANYNQSSIRNSANIADLQQFISQGLKQTTDDLLADGYTLEDLDRGKLVESFQKFYGQVYTEHTNNLIEQQKQKSLSGLSTEVSSDVDSLYDITFTNDQALPVFLQLRDKGQQRLNELINIGFSEEEAFEQYITTLSEIARESNDDRLLKVARLLEDKEGNSLLSKYPKLRDKLNDAKSSITSDLIQLTNFRHTQEKRQAEKKILDLESSLVGDILLNPELDIRRDNRLFDLNILDPSASTRILNFRQQQLEDMNNIIGNEAVTQQLRMKILEFNSPIKNELDLIKSIPLDNQGKPVLDNAQMNSLRDLILRVNEPYARFDSTTRRFLEGQEKAIGDLLDQKNPLGFSTSDEGEAQRQEALQRFRESMLDFIEKNPDSTQTEIRDFAETRALSIVGNVGSASKVKKLKGVQQSPKENPAPSIPSQQFINRTNSGGFKVTTEEKELLKQMGSQTILQKQKEQKNYMRNTMVKIMEKVPPEKRSKEFQKAIEQFQTNETVENFNNVLKVGGYKSKRAN